MSQPRLTVLYNADCPICSREIAHYRRHAEQRGVPLAFTPVAQAELAEWGLSADAALRRLHVRRGAHLLSGMEAFVALWRELPRYRWLARVVSLPGLRGVSDWLYNRVAAPALYRLHLARQARRAKVGDS